MRQTRVRRDDVVAATDEHSVPGWPWCLALAVAVSLAWRLPSLFDPPWVNDEGTYYAIAQGMAHGLSLYVGLWENKPPAIYLLYLGAYRLFGPSVLAIRLLACVAVTGVAVITASLGARIKGEPSAILSALLAGLLFGVPVLEGTTANAETFAAPLAALAVFLAVPHKRTGIAGIAIGCAVLFKSVELFDAAAIGIWLLRSGTGRIVPYVAGVVGPLAVTAVVAGMTGSLRAMIQDALLYDIGYVGHGNGGGVPWLLIAKLALLVTGTIWLRGRSFPAIWLLYATAGALFSGRIFGHYFLEAVVPFSLLVVPNLTRAQLRAAVAIVLATTVAAVLAVTATAAEIARVSGPSLLTDRLEYYANVLGRLSGTLSPSQYVNRLDNHVARNLVVAQGLARLPPGRLLVWGNTPWIYPLSDRLPATPYTSAIRSPEVPGETSALRAALSLPATRVVVVVTPPDPPLGRAGERALRSFREVRHVQNAVVYAR